MYTRREALGALASAAALPLMTGCRRDQAAGAGSADPAKDAVALLDAIGDNLVRLMPEAATSLGIDTGARASLRSQLADRSAEGQRRIASQVRADLDRVKAFNTDGLSHDVRTSIEAVRSAFATALEGFALPYGDITVGGWRNTPYVVIQNVGAYLDIPRFLDSDHRIENASDAEAYLARLQSFAKQLDGELGRMQAARGAGLVPALLPDRQGDGADVAVGQERARGRIAGRVHRAPDEEHPRQLGRTRADDRGNGGRARAGAAARGAREGARRGDQ